MMYEELVKSLRVEPFEVKSVGLAKRMNEAADAIEELSQKTRLLEYDFQSADNAYHSWFDAYQKDVPRWISVEERLPEEFVSVLVFIERDAFRDDGVERVKEMAIGHLYNGYWFVEMTSGVKAIAWMPLPSAPMEE